MDFLTSVARRQVEPGSGIRPRSPSRFAPPAARVEPPVSDATDLVEMPVEAVAPRPPSAAMAATAPEALSGGRASETWRVSDASRSAAGPDGSDRGFGRGRPRRPSGPERGEPLVALSPTAAGVPPAPSGRGRDAPTAPSRAVEVRPRQAPEGGPDRPLDGRPRSPTDDRDSTVHASERLARSHEPLVAAAMPSVAVAAHDISRLGPVESLRPAGPEPPVVTVTIGRVEVRALVAPPAEAAKPAARPSAPATVSLEDYLERRHGAAPR